MFGRENLDADELPLTSVEGIDDTTAEMLTEHGVASIQHLATSEPGELCDRTIVPLERVVDWIDQALLIRYLKRSIVVSRGLGIRAASDLAIVHARGDEALLGSLAEKTLLVTRRDWTTQNNAAQVASQLQLYGADLAAVIFNRSNDMLASDR